MKKISFLFLGLLLIPTLLLTSCDRGDDPTDGNVVSTPKFTLVKDYMVQNDLDIDKIDTNISGEKFVIAAPGTLAEVDAFLDTYYIMDIRSNTDFLAAHVNGANNIAFSNILTAAANATKPILVVCYTGQTACYATALLRMYGYTHTRALKWGMSGWNPNTAASWNGAIAGNLANGHINWSYDAASTNVVYKDPAITSQSSDGQAILKERVETVVALGFQGVNGSDVLGSPNNYFVNNYFSETDYLGFGHIANAYRIKENLLLSNDGYLGLNPAANAKVVTYCYTGQTSAVVTACLKVLGYDAYSLKFGMNGMYNNNPVWATNKWSATVSKNYPVFNN
jgi:rhodanese-related sulfurtransferase